MTLEMKMDEKWEAGRLEGRREGLLEGHREGHREGRLEGLQQGLQQGRIENERKLVSLICKKLAKGKTVDEIADMLEEEPDNIRLICEAAAKYAPEYNEDFVLKEMGLS